MRLPAFQRKPALAIAIEAKPKASPVLPNPHGDGGTGGDDPGADPTEEAAVCPECGCVFDDGTGEIVKEGDPRYPTEKGNGGSGGSGGDESGDTGDGGDHAGAVA